jgi:hypothetical protein
MAWVHQNSAANPWFVERLNGLAVETNALIPLKHRLMLAAVPPSNAPVALADGGGNMSNLEAARFTRMCDAAQSVKSFQEK